MVKFPTVEGIVVLKGHQQESRDLYEVANKPSSMHQVNSIMIGRVKVNLNEVFKFHKLDLVEFFAEQQEEHVSHRPSLN